MSTSVYWLRRDLRRRDNPALLAARDAAEAATSGGGSGGSTGQVLAVFVLEPGMWRQAGPSRRAWLAATLRATDEAFDGRLVVRMGDPRTLVPHLAAEVGAGSVHVARETTPYGRSRDEVVATALGEAGVEWVETGTPYAVGPGLVKNGSGDPYRVFTPFSRAWREHGWPEPAASPRSLDLLQHDDDERVAAMLDKAVEEGPELRHVGEEAALRQWREFRDGHLEGYDDGRDRPDLDVTSRLSAHLKIGTLHPRTLLADLADRRGKGPQTYLTELAWREFYADVLWHHPGSAWGDLRKELSGLRYDEPSDAIEAWKQGRTGFPIVDAGMRQLLGEGWMHNRLRMITGSFLTKDLHVWWPTGARHFLDHLVDGDIASNNHGWQWVAGTGTDASPYFRVFNPVTQGKKFDPDGVYVRRWVPELAHLEGKAAHEPWEHDGGYDHGYPQRIVDHKEEREEALARYQGARQ